MQTNFICLILVALFLLSSILNSQLLGEDEALTYLINTNIINHISNLNLKKLTGSMIILELKKYINL